MNTSNRRKFAGLALASVAALFSIASAHAASEVVIGQVAPMTGVIAATGEDYVAGAAAYFASVNAKGGVYGRKIRVVLKDDAYKPDATIAKTRELLDKDSPVALFGYIGTANITAMLKNNMLADNRIALLAPFTGGEEIRQPGSPNLFHIRASYRDETARMVAQLHTLGLRKFAVFYQNDGMGKSGLAGAESELAKLNLTLSAAGNYDRAKPEEIDEALNAILKAKPDAVIMASTTKATAAFVKRMHAAESKAKLFAISTVNTKEMLKITTPEVARGMGVSQVMPFPYNMASPLPIVREFHAAMKKFAPEKTISHTSMEGFIAAKVMVEAVRRSRADPSRERILAALSNLGEYDVGGFKVNFKDENRAGSKFVEVAVLNREGRLMR